jgi:hypothetical protein
LEETSTFPSANELDCGPFHREVSIHFWNQSNPSLALTPKKELGPFPSLLIVLEEENCPKTTPENMTKTRTITIAVNGLIEPFSMEEELEVRVTFPQTRA